MYKRQVFGILLDEGSLNAYLDHVVKEVPAKAVVDINETDEKRFDALSRIIRAMATKVIHPDWGIQGVYVDLELPPEDA